VIQIDKFAPNHAANSGELLDHHTSAEPASKEWQALDIVAASMNAIRDRALKVVLPEGEDERILRSAQQLGTRRLAHPVLLGAPADVQARAAGLGISLDGCAIRDPAGDGALAAYAGRLLANRERMTQSMAERTLKKPLYFGGAMLTDGAIAPYGIPWPPIRPSVSKPRKAAACARARPGRSPTRST
jgi:hypothetical protein